MAFFTRWIQNMAVFFVMSMMITKILPNDSYVKYIRLFLGLLLMMILLQPVEELLSPDGLFPNFVTEDTLAVNSRELMEEINRVENGRIDDFVKIQTEMMKTELNRELKAMNYEITDIALKEADEFGRNGTEDEEYNLWIYVKNINGTSYGENQKDSSWQIEIPVISIFQSEGEKKENNGQSGSYIGEDNMENLSESEKIKKFICNFYDMRSANINIIIQN